MKYNAKYDRWVSKDGLVYRYDSRQDKLVLCKLSVSHGYQVACCKKPKKCLVLVHRIVWETFNGPIPVGYVIDHKDTHKNNNNLSNLICCTQKENCNNPITRKHKKEKIYTEFGRKYFKHFGIFCSENRRQYNTECEWYRRNGKCRWEVEQ